MGFTVYYQSTESVDPSIKVALGKSLERHIMKRSWISCEPPGFFGGDDVNGILSGGSKPNFMPQPDDYLDPDNRQPDGTVQDVVDILCDLSSEFGIDWQFSHDHEQGPVGFVRNGVADEDLLHEIKGIAGIGSVVADALDNLPIQLPSRDPTRYEDENGDPLILKFDNSDKRQ